MVHSDSGSCCAIVVRDSQTHGFGTCMYKAVLSKAANGDGCVMIRPLTMTYRSQQRRQDSFMLCNFTNPLNNELFSVWLSIVEVVNVSIDNQPNAITSAIRNILINST